MRSTLFVYDFDRFNAADILPMFAKYPHNHLLRSPTMLRMMVKEDISKYDLSSVRRMTTAGEALNPEVYRQFKKATGLSILEGFGQTETTMVIGNLTGAEAARLDGASPRRYTTLTSSPPTARAPPQARAEKYA